MINLDALRGLMRVVEDAVERRHTPHVVAALQQLEALVVVLRASVPPETPTIQP